MTYHSSKGIWRANGDGSCPQRVPGYSAVVYGPEWNPSVHVDVTDCVDLQAYATGPARFHRGRSSTITIRLENHGNEPATDVNLRISNVGNGQVGGCAPLCRIARIDPGVTMSYSIPYRPLHAGRVGLRFAAHANEADLTPGDLSGSYVTVIRQS
jgi:hypothetical protein